MKRCPRCLLWKQEACFHSRKDRPGKLAAACKLCANARTAELRVAHRDAISAKSKAYNDANRERVREQKRRWNQENAADVREQQRRYREENRDYIKALHRRTVDMDPGKAAAKWAKRRAQRLQATPPWYDHEKAVAIYTEAREINESGGDVHVDHIIPLQGKTVCGLHVHNNLRIVPASTNLSKGNKLLEIA